jgi:peptidoglycan/xylan/chitin deacetylase (PgdA/CDA1 family)
VIVALAAIACRGKTERKDFGPRFFSGDSRVQCSKGVDRGHEWTHDVLAASLEHARDKGVVLHTYGHAPTLDLAEYVPDFDWAAANGVPMVTFRELVAGHTGAGWAFTVDDDEVDTWYGWRELLRAHHVKVTFFVTRYDRFTADQKRKLKELAADGHDIEAHGKAHENAVDYVAAHGIDAYLRDEVMPSKAALVADGYASSAFAYPYGAHSTVIDDALLPEFKLLRTTGSNWCLK